MRSSALLKKKHQSSDPLLRTLNRERKASCHPVQEERLIERIDEPWSAWLLNRLNCKDETFVVYSSPERRVSLDNHSWETGGGGGLISFTQRRRSSSCRGRKRLAKNDIRLLVVWFQFNWLERSCSSMKLTSMKFDLRRFPSELSPVSVCRVVTSMPSTKLNRGSSSVDGQKRPLLHSNIL